MYMHDVLLYIKNCFCVPSELAPLHKIENNDLNNNILVILHVYVCVAIDI